MKKKYLLLIILIPFLYACGPNKEEIAKREQFIADSLKRISEQQEKERIHFEKIEVGKSIKKTKLNKLLDELKFQLVEENKKLVEINSFQFGRSAQTKQDQVREQSNKIIEIETFIARIEKEISLTNLFQTFDFQLSPQGTIQYLFTSAQNRDLSKIRHLLDPYGEFDVDVLDICMVEIFPYDMQEDWIKTYRNGRIMSEKTIDDDNIELEVAIGESSDRLEKIKLVKRMDKWYLLSM